MHKEVVMRMLCNLLGFLILCSIGLSFAMFVFALISLVSMIVSGKTELPWWRFLVPIPFLLLASYFMAVWMSKVDAIIKSSLTFRRISKHICRKQATLRMHDRLLPVFNVFLISEVDQVFHGWSRRERNRRIKGSMSLMENCHPDMKKIAPFLKKGQMAKLLIPTFLSRPSCVSVKVEEVFANGERFQIWFSGNEMSEMDFPHPRRDIALRDILAYIGAARDETAFMRQ